VNLLVIGLNHKTADVEVREKVAFAGEKLEPAVSGLLALDGIDEAIVLSTCNRVEIYLNVHDTKKAEESVKDFIASFHNIRRDLLDPALVVRPGREGIRHIFRVASSLDSMVLGEPQILGQLKDAYEFALEHKATGTLLNRLTKKAISVAKRVRTETKIAENAVSISFAAVELAKKIFGDLGGKSAMLLGAGEMAELAAKHLINVGVDRMVVANRTLERAQELAREFNGSAIPFGEFPDELVRTDIVLCSTGAPEYVVTHDHVKEALKERRNKPLFLIDISVPRNLDPEINELDNAYLYDIDDLQGVVETNVAERRAEAERAERIVEEEIETFTRWIASLDAVPTVIALRERAEAVRDEELAKAFRRLGNVDPKTEKIISGLAHGIVNKMLHPPTVALRTEAAEKEILIDLVRRIYRLDGDEEDPRS